MTHIGKNINSKVLIINGLVNKIQILVYTF